MGSINVNARSTLVTTPCVLVIRSFPSWLLVLDELRLAPHAVLLEEATYVAAIRVLVPASCQIRVGDYSDVQFDSLGKTAVLLVDGGFTATLALGWHAWGIPRVMHTRQQRRSLSGWNNTSVALPQAYLGGVTLGTIQIGASFRGEAPGIASLPDIAPRDASMILSVKGVAHHYRRAPKT
jgi:hypothetical protein